MLSAVEERDTTLLKSTRPAHLNAGDAGLRVPCCMVAFCLALGCSALVPAAQSQDRRVVIAGEKLGTALPLLGKSFGQTIRVGLNSEGSRLFLMPVDRELPEVMVQLRSFLPYPPGRANWYREGTVHTFDEDAASRAARAKAVRDWENEQSRKRLDGLRRHAQALEREGRSSTSANRMRGYLSIFEGLPPTHSRAALVGRTVHARFGQLSPVAQDFIRRLCESGGIRRIRPEGASGDDDYSDVTVTVEPSGTPERPGLRMRLITGGNQGRVMPDLCRTDVETALKEALAYRQRRRGPEKPEAIPELQPMLTLLQPGELAGRGWPIEIALARVSEAARIPIIGQYDPCWTEFRGEEVRAQTRLDPLVCDRKPVWKAFEEMALRFDLEWDFKDGWIQLRTPRYLAGAAGTTALIPPAELRALDARR